MKGKILWPIFYVALYSFFAGTIGHLYDVAVPTAVEEALADDSYICTDRPTKSNSTCIVPTGEFQYETSLEDFTNYGSHSSDYRTNSIAATTIKYGVAHGVDIEAEFTPAIDLKVPGRPSELGIGDIYMRLKYQVYRDDTYAFDLLPWVKIPVSALPINDHSFEDGIIAPTRVNLPGGFKLLLDPEVDMLSDNLAAGYHANYQGLVNVSHPIYDNVTLYGEVWHQIDEDPNQRTIETSLDTAVAWAVQPNLQLDAGVNVGLTKQTPSEEFYVGVSQRF